MRRAKLIPKHLAEAGFLSKKAGSFSQVPQRTVQLWTEKGLITSEIADTTGTGSRRFYSVLNCIEIAIIRSLSESRLSFKIIEQIMKFLNEHQVTAKADDIMGSEYEKFPKDKSNIEKLLDEESAQLTIYMLDNGKIEFFASGESEKRSKLTGLPFFGIHNITPDGYDPGPKDYDKELTLHLTRIAQRVIDKMG